MLRDRFDRPLDEAAARFSSSVEEDEALLGVDLWGSIAHATMLGEARIVPSASARRIVTGLRAIGRQASIGRFRLDPDLEDVHLNVEAALTRALGPDGERLHTGRSRNDQVATDLALFEREGLLALEGAVGAVADALLVKAAGAGGRRNVDGWTHMQPAQRVPWAALLGAHALRFARDVDRLAAVREGISDCPLGSGALAGSSLPLDRRLTARLLGFARPSPSSIDAVSDRDAAIETLFAATLAQVHASQLSEELVLGAMPEIGRVRLSDPFVTTSSLMPHKRNPDLAELVRAESASAIGRLTAHLTLVRALPLGYQRDLQAAKPILLNAIARTLEGFRVLAPMIAGATLLVPPPQGATASVELADALVAEGVPFRSAHGRVARWLAEGERRGIATPIREAFPELSGGGFVLPEPDEEAERRTTEGGSSRRSVDRLLAEIHGRRRRQIARSAKELARLRTLTRRAGLRDALFEMAPVRARRRASAASSGRVRDS